MNEYLWKKLKDAGLIPQDADISALNLETTVGSLFTEKKLDMLTYTGWCDEAKAADVASKTQADATRKQFATDIATGVATALAPLLQQAIGGTAQQSTAVADDLDQRASGAANRIANTGRESNVNALDAFKAAQTSSIKGVKAQARYSSTKGTLCYPDDGRASWQRKGNPVQLFQGRMNQATTVDELSQAEYAKAAALAMWYARKAGVGIVLPDHHMQLLQECLHEDEFVDETHSARKLTDFEIKTILDDGTSGGSNAVPEWFDYALITAPLLFGELFPYVNVIPVPRGSAADGATYGTPTFVSTAEGSAVTPFSTTSFIGAFDTTFYPATCAIEMGLDWESDAVPGIGQQIIAKISQEAQRWLDEQIAVGDGTTEPQGIFTATGISASAENGTTGSLTYNDALNMVFGMGKAARVAFGGNRTRYVLNDTQYKKFMQMATGVTGDDRPMFGMNVKAYQLGDYGVSVQQNITSGDMAFANLGAYRLYRRQGLQFVSDDTGRTNRLANTRLVVARMRWGGQVELPTTYVVQMLNGSTT